MSGGLYPAGWQTASSALLGSANSPITLTICAMASSATVDILLCVYVCHFTCRLARYNEPWLPLPFRRNEILIDLDDFRWT